MNKHQQQKGFTLVELAIVLTIIGLLIGGILKGQQLMQNARVSATVAQINGYESATTAFRDAFGMLPGDLVEADKKIASCGTGCGKVGNGDGKIGARGWNLKTYQGDSTGGPVGAEAFIYWYELQTAGYISGVDDEFAKQVDANSGSGTTAISFGSSIPVARVGGGFWAGNSDGTQKAPGLPTAVTATTLVGSVIAMVGTPSDTLGDGTGPTDKFALTPTIAAQIDRKVDDGIPTSGQVQAFGKTLSCFQAKPSDTSYTYQEGVTSKDCGLYIRIQR